MTELPKLPWRPITDPGDYVGQIAVLAWLPKDSELSYYLDWSPLIAWNGQAWEHHWHSGPISPDGRQGFWIPEVALMETIHGD